MELSVYFNEDIVNRMYEGIYIVDKTRKITFWNKGAERITGFSAKEVVGSFCHDNILNHVDQDNNMLCLSGCPLEKSIKDGQPREAKVYLHHKAGHRVAVSVMTTPIRIDGEITGAIEVFLENVDRAEMNETIRELTKLALYDQLTQLPNRRYIDSFLKNRLREYYELKIPFAVVMLDIDLFKNVNDTYGHDIGDEVLRMLARTLENAFRKSDLIGRWGGEEFIAVLTAVNGTELEIICEKVRSLVGNSVLRTKTDPVSITVSLGATLIKPEDTDKTIIKRADDALYESKKNGRNRVTIV